MTTPQTPDELQRLVLDAFPGATLADAKSARHRIYANDHWFGDVAPAMWDRGWAVYPQTRRAADGLTAKRVPASIGGTMIKTSLLATRMPSAVERDEWCRLAPSHNVALFLGPAEGGPIAIDIDIRMPELSNAVEDIVREILPATPFWRGSDGAKRVAIFRSDPADPIRRKREHKLIDKAGRPVVDSYGKACAIEILSAGNSVTLHGLHHATGAPFRWEAPPVLQGPELAPLVTAAALRACLEAISERVVELTGLGRGYDVTGARLATGEVTAAVTDSSGVVVPGNREGVADATYGRKGKVTDGREPYVRSRAFRYAIANRPLLATEAGRRAVAGRLFEECKEVFDGLGSGRYSAWGDEGGRGANAGNSVLHDCRAKLESARLTLAETPDRFVRTVGRDESGRKQLAVRTGVGIDRGADDELGWIEPDTVSLSVITAHDQARKAAERALLGKEGREEGQRRVAREVRATIDRFLDQADAQARNAKAPLTKVILMRAPVGAGKTSTFIERIAARPRRGKPVVMFLPSYANIEEAASRAENRRTAAAAAATPAFRQAAAEVRAQAEAVGLKVGILRGVERAGCTRVEQRQVLRAQGAPAHGLCSAKVAAIRGMEKETVYCSDHPEAGGACPVIADRKALATCDLVLAPTVFLTIGLPPELKDECCGLAVDERCAFEFLRYDSMPLASLLLPRPEPHILESDGEGVTSQDLLLERERVARLVHDALARGEDPAAAINAAAAQKPTLFDDVKSAKTVASRAQRAAAQVVPNCSAEYLKELFAKAKATDIRQENKLWDVILDRLAALKADALTRSLARSAGVEVDPCMLQARGERDARVQVLVMGETGQHVRVSWREAPCLTELPTLLLDASGDADITEKVWCGRDVETVDIAAYLHVRTVVCLDSNHSTTSYVPELNTDDEGRKRSSRQLVSVRRAVNNVAHVKAGGRVGVALPLRGRKALQRAHAEAPNVDVMHYGAIRGLDFAKRHKALMTVGRHEFPVWVIDALAAALTYDDIVPEAPFDVQGDGLNDEGKPISQPMSDRTYPLRDGRDLIIQVPEYPGRWAASVQRQFREEELVQAMGRLRPVYRDDVGLWIAVSRVLPAGIVVDAVTTLRSLSTMRGAGAHFEAVRRAGGVADPEVIARVAPDVGVGPTTLASHGLAGTDTTGELAAGMDVWSVTADGRARVVQVPGYHEEAASEIVDAYDRAGMRVDSLQLVREATGKVPSERKKADKVDDELGTRDERREAEAAARAAAQAHVPQPERPFGDAPNLLTVGREPRATDVEVAMILATQCEVDPQEAARLNREATVDEAAEEATDQAAAGAALPAVSTGPGSPAALRSIAARWAGAVASSSGASSPARSGAPLDGRAVPPPLRLAPGLRRHGS